MTGIYSLDRLEEAMDAMSASDPRTDRLLTGAMDATVDLVQTGSRAELNAASLQAKRLYESFVPAEGLASDASYVAGRLAALADVLGLAAERRTVPEFDDRLRKAKFVPLLQTLLRQPASNAQVAASVGETEEAVCRKLRDLREVGAVYTHKRGRSVLNFLTPAARAYAETLPARSVGRSAFDMRSMGARSGVSHAPMPRLSGVGRREREPAVA